MNKKIVLGLTAIVILIIVGVGIFNKQKLTLQNKGQEIIIKVGVNLPLSGALATYGISVQEGILFAKENYNDSLKKYGIQIDFDFQDNKGEAKNAVSIFQKHKLENVNVYMSGVTQQSMAIKDQVYQARIPHFLWAFTPLYLEKGQFIFRNYVNFGIEAKYYLNFIKNHHPKKIALIYVNIAGTDIQFNQVVKPQLIEMGIDEILQEPYDISKSDYKDLATKLKLFKPDLIILNGFKDNLIQIIKDFSTYNIIKNSTVMCSFDLLDAANELNNELIEGLYVTSPTFDSRKNTNAEAWKEKFKIKFSKEPKYTNAYAYDNFLILLEAIRNCSQPYNRDSLSLEILKLNLQGITGPLTFQENGELNLSLEICKYRDGKLLPLE